MEDKDPLGILNKSDNTTPDPLGILKGGEKKNSTTQSPSPSDIGTSPSMDGASAPQGLPTVNPDLNAGVIQPPAEPLLRPNEPSITVAQPQGLSVATAPTYATTKEVNQEGGALSESAKALQAGVATVGAIAARTPAYTSDFVNRAINTVNPLPETSGTMLNTDLAKQPNSIAENLEQIAKDASAESNKDYKDENGNVQGAYDLFSKGEIKKGLGKLANNVIESLPVSAGIIAASAAGVSTAGLIAGGSMAFGAQEKQNLLEKNEENKKQGLPTMSDEDINTVSLISGTLEGVTEAAFGNVKFASFYKNLVEKEGAEAARSTIEPTVKEILKKGFGRYLGTSSEDAVSEWANQYLDNLNHIIIGGDTKTKPWDNVMESALTGLGSAGVIGAPIVPKTLLDVAREKSHVKKAQDIKKQQDALNAELNNPNTPPETKAIISKKLEDIGVEENDAVQESTDRHERLTDEAKTQVDNLRKEDNETLTAAIDPNISKEAKEALVTQVEKNDKKIEEIHKEADKQQELDKKLSDNINETDYEGEWKGILAKEKEKLKKEAETKKQKEDAIKEREVEQSDKSKHQDRNESKSTTETSGSNSDEQIREKQQEEVNHLIVAHAPTETTEANITSSVSKEPLSEKGEAIAEKVGEQAKDEGVKTIIIDTKTTRNKETAEKAAEISGAKVEEVKDLHTWDKGSFAGIDSKDWKKAEKYFLEHPNQTEYEGKKINESFNEFKDRYLEAKEKAQSEVSGKTLFVASSTAIRLEQALEKANGIWGKKAVEHFLDNSIEHEGDIEANPEHQGTENNEKEAAIKKLEDDFTISQAIPLDKIDVKNKKIDAVLKRVKEQHEAGVVGKREFNKYQKLFSDLKSDANEAFKEKRKDDNRKVADNIAEKILNPTGNKKVIKNGPDVEKAVRLLLKHGADAVTLYQNTTDDINEALNRALETLKKHPLYKALNASKNLPEDFDKLFKENFKNPPETSVEAEKSAALTENNRQQTNKSQPDIYGEKREYAVVKRLKGNAKVKKIFDLFKNKDLQYDSISSKKSTTYVNKLLDEYDANNSLLELAQGLIEGKSPTPEELDYKIAVRLADKLRVKAEQETNEFLRDATFNKAAELSLWWGKEANMGGKKIGIAADDIANMLPSSKDGLKVFAAKEMETLHDRLLTPKEKTQIDAAAKEINDLIEKDTLSDKDLAMLSTLVDEKIKEISDKINGKEISDKINAFEDEMLVDLTDC